MNRSQSSGGGCRVERTFQAARRIVSAKAGREGHWGWSRESSGKCAGGEAGLVAEVGALWFVSQEFGLHPLQAHGGPPKCVKLKVSVYVCDGGGVHQNIICIFKDNISYKQERAGRVADHGDGELEAGGPDMRFPGG